MALRRGMGAQLAWPNADDVRYDMSNFVPSAGATRVPVGALTGGVTAPLGQVLLVGRADMKLDIIGFNAIGIRDNGVVPMSNDGTVTAAVTLGTAPTSNTRLDLVYCKQNDSSGFVTTPDAAGAGVDQPIFGVVQGSAAPTPVPNYGGLPAGAAVVGIVLVGTNQTTTSSMTLMKPFYMPIGNVLTVNDASYRDTMIPAPSTLAARIALQNSGLIVDRLDLGWQEQYYAEYNSSTNPQGAKTAGWYPCPNQGPILTAKASAASSVGTTASRIPWATPDVQRWAGTAFNLANGEFTLPYEGIYRVTLQVGYSGASAAGLVAFVQDSAQAGDYYAISSQAGATNPNQGASSMIPGAAGATLSPFFGTVSSSASVRTDRTRLVVEWVGPRQV